jgi:alpha-galactosidase
MAVLTTTFLRDRGIVRGARSCLVLLLALLGPLEAQAPAQTEVAISSADLPDAPRIGGASVVGLRAGTPFLHRVAAVASSAVTFEALGLPPGSSIDPTTGIISGSVASEGSYPVTVRVSNAAGTAEKALTLVVGDTLALTPPMGWNSYDSFDDVVNESQFLQQAEWLSQNLQPFGWDTVVIDYRWYDPSTPASDQNGNNPQLTIDANGRLQPAVNRFPSAANGAGFRSIAERVHALGLKFGIHIMRGIPRLAVNANLPIAGSSFSAQEAARASTDNGYLCVWNSDMYGVQGATPAGQAWYDALFAQYAEWGIDFVKVDDATKNRPAELVEYHQSEVEAIQNAIHKAGRSIVLSLSPGESLISAAAHLSSWANMWRMSDDFWDRWANLDYTFTLADRWEQTGGQGRWPDADMLPIGHLGPSCPVGGADRETRFTRNEQVLMLTLWSVLPSPYMLGANLVQSASDGFFMSLVRNEEVIAVHQDSLGAKARGIARDPARSIWLRPLSGGRAAVGLFNRTATDQAVAVSLAELGIAERRLVRNAWLRLDLPPVDPGGSLEVSVPSHAGALLVLSPEVADAPAGGAPGDGAAGTGTFTAPSLGDSSGTPIAANPSGSGDPAGQGGSSDVVAAGGDPSTTDGAAVSPSVTSKDGCGCRMVEGAGSRPFWYGLAAMFAWYARRRRIGAG